MQGEKKDDLYGSISYPVFQTATFAHPAVGRSTGFDYTRTQNPTRAHLERLIASLEGGVGAVAFSSGMAAIDTVCELFKTGDRIIADIDLYGGSFRLFENVLKKDGIDVSFDDLSSKESIDSLFTPKTRAVYIETPTNPMMRILDISGLSKIAHSHGAILIVDNTFLTPYFQNPLSLGADIVIHSGTKFLGGHNDTLCGAAVTSDPGILERLRYFQNTKGNGISPFDAWLIARGIKTLPLRMEKASENAAAIASFLSSHELVSEVFYPELLTGERREILDRQARGHGSMITVNVISHEIAIRVLEKVRVFSFAESLGGVESLITYPVTQTHKDMPAEALERSGITDRTLRLSVGIESEADLIADLKQAFGR